MQPLNPPRSWWHLLRFRVSVRAMMILVLIVGGGLGWFVERAKVQHDAVIAIKRAGGYALYDWQYQDGFPTPNGKLWAPKWLVDLVGVDYLGNVVEVHFPAMSSMTDADLIHVGRLGRLEALDLTLSPVTNSGLAHLKGLTHLRSLVLGFTQVTDSGLVHLEGLTGLRDLDLYETTVTDSGLKHLSGLSRLQTLHLSNTRVSDAGLVHLKTLIRLQRLDLGGTAVTRSGVRELRKSLPSAVIGYDRRALERDR